MKRHTPLMAIIMALLICGCSETDITPENPNKKCCEEQTSPVYTFANPSSPVAGSTSSLTRDYDGISASFETDDITPGDAYTVWFVIFNEPGNCGSTPCGEADIFNPATKTDVTLAAGNVAGANSLKITARRNLTDKTGSAIPFFNQLLDGNLPVLGLIDPMKAEVHLVLRSHGPMVNGEMPAQINTYEGGCYTYLDPPEIPGAIGECADTHFAVHLP